jgi:hypothetical protein
VTVGRKTFSAQDGLDFDTHGGGDAATEERQVFRVKYRQGPALIAKSQETQTIISSLRHHFAINQRS